MSVDVEDSPPLLLLAHDLVVSQDTGLEEGIPLLLLHPLAFVATWIASGTHSIPHPVLDTCRTCGMTPMNDTLQNLPSCVLSLHFEADLHSALANSLHLLLLPIIFGKDLSVECLRNWRGRESLTAHLHHCHRNRRERDLSWRL